MPLRIYARHMHAVSLYASPYLCSAYARCITQPLRIYGRHINAVSLDASPYLCIFSTVKHSVNVGVLNRIRLLLWKFFYATRM